MSDLPQKAGPPDLHAIFGIDEPRGGEPVVSIERDRRRDRERDPGRASGADMDRDLGGGEETADDDVDLQFGEDSEPAVEVERVSDLHEDLEFDRDPGEDDPAVAEEPTSEADRGSR